MLGYNVGQCCARGIMHQAPEAHFLGEEAFVVLLGGESNGVVLGKERLHQDAPRGIATPGAPRRLGKKLERALGGAEVRQTQPDIGRDGTDQCDSRKVVPFGDQLRPHQDVNLALAEIVKHFAEVPTTPRSVAVQSLHPCTGKKLRQLRFDLFSALTHVLQVLARASGTPRGDIRGIAAVMAHQAVGATVIGERNGAIHAALRLATTATEQKPGVAAPVEQDHGLGAGFERRVHCLLEPARDGHLKLRLAKLLPHVHDFHAGQLASADPLLERVEAVLALSGIPVGLERGGGRAQHGEGVRQPCPHHGHIAPVVARSFFLFVARLVLLVHHHQAQLVEWSEHGRARAQHHLGFAALDAPPGLVPIAFAQSAMQNRNCAEPRHKLQLHRGRQGNFRDQHQRRATQLQAAGNQAHVDFRLAAAGNPVQQRHSEFAVFELRAEVIKYRGLLGCERRGPWGPVAGSVRRIDDWRSGSSLRYFYQSGVCQFSQLAQAGARGFQQVAMIFGGALAFQRFDNAARNG